MCLLKQGIMLYTCVFYVSYLKILRKPQGRKQAYITTSQTHTKSFPLILLKAQQRLDNLQQWVKGIYSRFNLIS
jgi:hypothetical protein